MNNQDYKCIIKHNGFRNLLGEIVEWGIDQSEKNTNKNVIICREYPEFKSYAKRIYEIVNNETYCHSMFYDSFSESTPPNTLKQQITLVLETFLEYIDTIITHETPKPNANEILERFITRIELGTHEITYYPLFNLDLNSSPRTLPFVIEEGIEICGLTSEVRSIIKNEAVERYNLFSNYPAPLLFIKVSLNKIKDRENVGKIIQSIPILLFGLYNVYAEIPMTFQGTVGPWHPWKFHSSTGPAREKDKQLSRKQISGIEFDSLTRYFKSIDIEEIDKYFIAYKRILSSLKKDFFEIEDKVIDVAIAFESLFEGSDNITFRLSTIPALVLRDNVEEREHLSNLIKDFYKYRSYIVHGESKNKRKNKFFTGNGIESNLNIIISTIQNLLRLMLLNPTLRTSKGHKILILSKETNLSKNIDSYLKSKI